ncbi:MAG: hypothetical protein ABI389_11635 [Rhodanobacter sp.]
MAPLPGDAPATRRVTAESLRHGLRGGHHDVPIEHPRSEYQLHASGNDKLIPTRQ